MKEGWSYKKLGEVCEVISGQSPEGKFYNTEGQGTPFYQGKKEFSSKYIGNPTTWTTVETKIAEKDDLLMSVRAPVGDINFATQRLCIGRGLAAIRTKEDIDKEYLFYFLVAQKSCIKGKEGVGFASINRKEIMDIDVQYPKDFSEQRSIVTRLDAAFSHIDALKANAEKQLNEARKLFQAELTECMKPKEGWEEKTLKEVGITQTGTTPPKSDTSNYGEYISFIRPAELNFDGMGGINYESEIKLSEKGVERSRLIKANSILMCCIGSVGKMGFSTKEVTCNQQINTITPKSNYSPKFVYYAMLDKKFLDDIIKEAKSAQATLPIISKGKWERHKIHVPSLVEQHAIVSHLNSLSSTIRKLEELQQKTIAECDALKQAMLKEIFE